MDELYWFLKYKPRTKTQENRDYPEFCVTAKMRCKIELNISRRERRWLRPPCLQHNADKWECQGRRSRSYTLDIPPQQVLIRHTLSEIDGQLRMDAAPVLSVAGPLFRDVDHRQIQHFEKTAIGRKHGFRLGYLPELLKPSIVLVV